MEQQRLFAWSETSGLLDMHNADDRKIRQSNTFVIHRTTILDLLVQIQCLFQEFERAQKKNSHLIVVPEPVGSEDEFQQDPAKDSSTAHVPLPERRRHFIIKAMKAVKSTAEDNLSEGKRRLRWAAFDKDAFEELLRRFSMLNDNMTDILDTRLQREIHRTTQDTNRGVLQLHKDLSSLHQLVMALDIRMQAHVYPVPSAPQYNLANDASGLQLLAQLAKFKAFNESLENDGSALWDDSTALVSEKANIKIDRSDIVLESVLSGMASCAIRSEALYRKGDIVERVWIEWKEYSNQMPGSPSPAPIIIDRVQRLASLLHHRPKPEAFRVPHCLGYFLGQSDSDIDSECDDDVDTRIGFVFEKPKDEGISPETPPISLFDLIHSSTKPRVTERIRVAHAVSNSLLYLHSVNWLHKGLRSHNIVFFPVATEPKDGAKSRIDYTKPYLSGFDFARPGRADEQTEIPGDDGAYNLYRHPATQGHGFGPRESFRKSFDIYSLGVVMVELAHWETIDNVLGLEVEKGRLRVMARVREMLLNESRMQEVGSNMGEIYETATRKCITGGVELGIGEKEDERSDHVAAKMSMAFYEDVVKKLGDVRV